MKEFDLEKTFDGFFCSFIIEQEMRNLLIKIFLPAENALKISSHLAPLPFSQFFGSINFTCNIFFLKAFLRTCFLFLSTIHHLIHRILAYFLFTFLPTFNKKLRIFKYQT